MLRWVGVCGEVGGWIGDIDSRGFGCCRRVVRRCWWWPLILGGGVVSLGSLAGRGAGVALRVSRGFGELVVGCVVVVAGVGERVWAIGGLSRFVWSSSMVSVDVSSELLLNTAAAAYVQVGTGG